MEYYLSLFVRAVFIENMALAFFLGMCTFIAVPKKLSRRMRRSAELPAMKRCICATVSRASGSPERRKPFGSIC